jgi:GNAT superfamily N-acetyltransferase
VPLDREDILAGRCSAAAALARGDRGKPMPLRCPPASEALDAMIWSGRYVVAVQERRPIAGAGWELSDDGTLLVRDLYVHPEHAGRGHARRLLARIEATAAALNRRP